MRRRSMAATSKGSASCDVDRAVLSLALPQGRPVPPPRGLVFPDLIQRLDLEDRGVMVVAGPERHHRAKMRRICAQGLAGAPRGPLCSPLPITEREGNDDDHPEAPKSTGMIPGSRHRHRLVPSHSKFPIGEVPSPQCAVGASICRHPCGKESRGSKRLQSQPTSFIELSK